MKKFVLVVMALVITAGLLSGCGRQDSVTITARTSSISDTSTDTDTGDSPLVDQYESVIISLPDGRYVKDVFRDFKFYDNGMVKVVMMDYSVYLVDTKNVVFYTDTPAN